MVILGSLGTSGVLFWAVELPVNWPESHSFMAFNGDGAESLHSDFEKMQGQL